MEIIAEYGTLFVFIAVLFGLYMTWGIGANDVANPALVAELERFSAIFPNDIGDLFNHPFAFR